MTSKNRRKYTAPPDDKRCHETIALKDGSLARCMKPACYTSQWGQLAWCKQHARMRSLLTEDKP